MTLEQGIVVVITGASSGIGRATAHVLARRGAHLVLAARQAEALEAVVHECRERGGEALAVVADVTDATAIERLAAAAVARFGRIDVWFNNAGVLLLGLIDATPAEELGRVVEVDVIGACLGARVAVRRFRAQGYGTLILTGSMLGEVVEPYVNAYAAGKFAVRGLGEALRQELRDEPAIRVCTVLPIGADTPIFQRAANHTGRQIRATPPVVDPYDVAETVASLISRPQDEVIVGAFGRVLKLGKKLMPLRLFEHVAGLVGPRIQLRPEPAPPSSGNLFEPARDGLTVKGGWSTIPLYSERQLGIAIGLLAATAAGLLFILRRGRTR